MSYTHLDPGRELEVCGHIYSNQIDLSELVLLTPEELKAREAASVEQEKAIYDRMVEIEKEWVQQASPDHGHAESPAVPENAAYPPHRQPVGRRRVWLA